MDSSVTGILRRLAFDSVVILTGNARALIIISPHVINRDRHPSARRMINHHYFLHCRPPPCPPSTESDSARAVGKTSPESTSALVTRFDWMRDEREKRQHPHHRRITTHRLGHARAHNPESLLALTGRDSTVYKRANPERIESRISPTRIRGDR